MKSNIFRLGLTGGIFALLLLVGGLFAGPVSTLAQSLGTPSALLSLAPATPVPAAGLGLNPNKGRLFTGVVSAVNPSSLTLTRRARTVTVNTDSSTKIVKAGKTISLSDVKANDRVLVRGKKVNGVVTASLVAVIVPHTSGTVTAINGTSISLVRNFLSGTFSVNSSTVYVRGKETISLADLKVGDKILAQGTANSDGTLTATFVRVAVH